MEEKIMEKMMIALKRDTTRRHSTAGFAAVALTLLMLWIFPAINRAAELEEPGKALFEKRCTGCHTLEKNYKGPRLAGVIGRPAGSVPGFQYSNALKSAHFVWDDTRLDQWLTDTESVVEDNNMDFHVGKADERAQIISYLKSLSPAQQNASNAASPAR
jgi:cytochrome c2